MVGLPELEAALAAAGCNPKGGAARCPRTERHTHGDRNPSLSYRESSDGTLLALCHAPSCGAKLPDVLDALNLRQPAAVGARRRPDDLGPVLAQYVYTDLSGAPVRRVRRHEGKQFRQDRHEGGRWRPGTADRPADLYRLPEIVAAIGRAEVVWIAAGEKDADALVRAGVEATTISAGEKAESWSDRQLALVAKARAVVICRDRDDTGHAYADALGAKLVWHGAVVRIVEAAHGKDAADHLAAGRTLDEFRTVREAGAAAARPPTKVRATAADPAAETLPEPPMEMLPAPVARWVVDVAEHLSVPRDLTATMALGTLAATTTGKVSVRVDATWDEPVALYVVCAMPPASRKSRVLTMAAQPLMDYMHELVDDWRAAPPEYRGPDPRVLLAGDATQEGLGIRLAQTGGRCAILDAEGDWLDIMAGRYSTNPSMGVALKGWSAEAFDVTRAGRPDIHLPSITLSAALAIQPQVLQDLASKPQALERGLIPRLLICQPPRMRSRRGPAVSDATLEGWARLTRTMAATFWALPRPVEVRMDDDARALLADYHERIEDRIEGDLAHLASWAGKSVGTAARLAALLHVTDRISVGWPSMVSGEYVAAAVAWMDHYAAWALRCYPRAPDDRLERIKPLAEWLVRERPATFSRREASRGTRPVTHFAADLQEPLDLLVEQGALEVVEQEYDGPVKRRTGDQWKRYRVVQWDELRRLG